MAKHHLFRAVGLVVFGFEELGTWLWHIASIVNSRPFVSMSENSAIKNMLTPAYFLNGGTPSTFIKSLTISMGGRESFSCNKCSGLVGRANILPCCSSVPNGAPLGP